MTITAIEQAITFLSRTDLTVTARQQPLPPGVTDLLKISSGDHDVLLVAQQSSRYSLEDVRHAAEFYVQQILFAPDSNHYRVLGVEPSDPEAKIKLHYRLLVSWLHPDKNSSDWEVVFSERINRAWHGLRTSERRRQYDEQLSAKPAAPKPVAAPIRREIKPAQWHDRDIDSQFISARTIKRLPIVMFSLLGVGAVLALWLLIQTQPNLQRAEIVLSNGNAELAEEQTAALESTPVQIPKATSAPVKTSVKPVQTPPETGFAKTDTSSTATINDVKPSKSQNSNARANTPATLPGTKAIVSTPKTVAPVMTAKVIALPAKPLKMATPTKIVAPQIAAKVLAIPSKMPKTGTPTKVAAPEMAAKLLVASSKTPKASMPTKATAAPIVSAIPAQAKLLVASSKTPKASMPTKATAAPIVPAVPALANEAKIAGKRARNIKTAQTAPALVSTAGLNVIAKTSTSVPSDVSVKQFLRNFSRVYAEGDYFALHNLFTQDLSILGAPPQRKTLRSYRQLFETSQSRQIALDHVSWLASDDKITVIASYQVQIMALGEAETQSSRGDIRLDLRMENGRLKIIRLQSDDKNG